MNTEFFTALELLEREKGIPQSYMMEKIEAALVSAFKKEYGSNTNVRVHIDPAKKDVRVYQQKEVVEVVEDPAIQISLEDAKAISKRNTLGKIVEFEVKTKNFRRLSAFYVNAGSNEIFIFCLVVLFLLFAALSAGEARKIYHIHAKKNISSNYTTVLPWRRLPATLLETLLSPVAAVCFVIWLITSIVNLS